MTSENKVIADNIRMPDGGKTSYNSFDLAKFICSVMVVMVHVAPFGVQEGTNVFSFLNTVLQKGLCRMAVPLFFILSGFFLYKKTPLDRFSLEPTKKYLTHILKIYLLWSAIYFPLSLREITAYPGGVLNGVIAYIRDFVVRGSYLQLWYLTGLMAAVVLVSFLLYRNRKPKRILLTSFVFYVIGLLGDGYYGIIEPLFSVPVLGDVMGLYYRCFITTRNGLFFAFFLVSVGMVLSHTDKILPPKKSLFLFILSLLMICAEGVFLKVTHIAKAYSVILFALPTALFGFMFLKSLKLKDRKIYKTLRNLSSLNFYVHMWAYFIVSQVISGLGKSSLNSTPVPFLATLALTLVLSMTVLMLSKKKGFRWLKKLY